VRNVGDTVQYLSESTYAKYPIRLYILHSHGCYHYNINRKTTWPSFLTAKFRVGGSKEFFKMLHRAITHP
jgi:hypothetical protein